MRIKTRSILKRCTPLAYGLIFAAYSFRDLFFKNLYPGGGGDARLTLFNYEHWWSFFQGKESLTSISFFAPAQNWLGASETYLTQGIVYSFFRMFHLSLIQSWFLTNFVLLAIGGAGLYLLLRSILQEEFLTFCAAFLVFFSYQINTQLVHPQTYAFLLMSWVFYFGLNLSNNTNFKFSFIGLMISLAIIIPAAWYGVFATVLITGLALFILFFIDKALLVLKIKEIRDNLMLELTHNKSLALFLLLPFLSILLFVKMYSGHLFDRTFGDFSTVSFYSPRYMDLWNASIGASGLDAKIYNYSKLGVTDSFERAMGFPIIFALLIACVVLYLLLGQKHSVKFRLIALLAVFISVVPLTDERGQSFWYFLWVLPGGNSIRTPARLWIYGQILWSILIVLMLHNFYAKKRISKYFKVLMVSTVLVVGLNQYRPSMSGFDGLPLTSFGIRAETALSNKGCSIIYLGTNQPLTITESIDRQLDGIAIAYRLGIPTSNGYSSKVPPNWPQGGAWGLVDSKSILEWVKSEKPDFKGKFCYYSEAGLQITEALS